MNFKTHFGKQLAIFRIHKLGQTRFYSKLFSVQAGFLTPKKYSSQQLHPAHKMS